MRVSRLFTSSRLEPGAEVSLESKSAHYVLRVLKLRQGDTLVVFNGDGSDYVAEIDSNRRDQLELKVTARLPAVPESKFRVTLAQSVGKGDRMDYSLQKATELGVHAIQPLFTERTEVKLDEKRLARRMEHWYRILISACEQCGRAVVPDLQIPARLVDWLAVEPAAQKVVLAPGGERALAALPVGSAGVTVVVGPEGGFSDLEMKQLALAGVIPVSLGPRVLRTESAGPAALAVLQALHGDLN